MIESNDGGPAFPNTRTTRLGDASVTDALGGMSLRDYFAAKAMQAMVGVWSEAWCTPYGDVPKMSHPASSFRNTADANDEELDAFVASNAYIIADAMLAERAKREGGAA